MPKGNPLCIQKNISFDAKQYDELCRLAGKNKIHFAKYLRKLIAKHLEEIQLGKL